MTDPETISDYIVTYTGRRFYPFSPNADDIDIRDIGHGLANVARFSGQTRSFYSVAEHSIRVAEMCTRKEDAFAGLMHDASEAYIHDVASPIKYAPGFLRYRLVEENIMTMIAEKFGFAWPMPKTVYDADHTILHTEARDMLMAVPGWFDSEACAAHPRIAPYGSHVRVEHSFMFEFTTLSR